LKGPSLGNYDETMNSCLDLPIELILLIFSYFDVKCLCNLKYTCRHLYFMVSKFAKIKYNSKDFDIYNDIFDLISEMEQPFKLIHKSHEYLRPRERKLP
jgi:hypothetical protein